MATEHQHAWDAFWAGQSGGNGCLPGSSPSLENAQRKAWAEFARTITRKGRVLDLATGDGRVMRWMREARGDLDAVGVDLAKELPPPPKGTKVLSSVDIRALPFRDAYFPAVVSQFGLEYAELESAIRELRRVLAPSGRAALMTHRLDGPILAYSLARQKQIYWAIEEEDLPGRAKRSLLLRQSGVAIVPPVVAEAPLRAAQRFGQASAAWEIAEALRRTLAWGVNDNPLRVGAAIDAIATQARHEIARIRALEQACLRIDDAETFAATLRQSGLVQTNCTPLHETGTKSAFADFRIIEHD